LSIRTAALTEINKLRSEGHDIRAAVASRTDNPAWAHFCMENLVLPNNISLRECFGNLVEISFNDKTHHFRLLHEKTKIPYENMVFFDNEDWNIMNVSKLGVTSIHTENGMHKDHWEEAKRAFGL
jgi:magnesium-dependent phosphatase 1